ncbi:MAG: hypothetical protein K2Q22_08760 [Cytophagales bacterium]|nr:hypothetical protein [Cytophagales bacterium]
MMSRSGTNYFTFNDLSGYTAQGAKELLQLQTLPSNYIKFNTLQVIDNIQVPFGRGNNPAYALEPIISTYPEFGRGGATQVITSSPIVNYSSSQFVTPPTYTPPTYNYNVPTYSNPY